MATPKLSPELHSQIIALKARGWSHKQVADELGVGVGTVSNCIHKPIASDRIDESAAWHREKFLELQARFNKWIGDTAKPPKGPAVKKGARKKNAACNDIHAPAHREDILARFIKENRDAHACWVVGDPLDLFNFSRYPKTKRPFSPVEEFQSGRVIIRALSENFPEVLVLPGNHDMRLLKYLTRMNIPPDIIEFFELACPDFTSPLAKMCAGFENVKMMEPKKIDYAEYPFIHQIGDLVLSHAEKYSVIPNKAVNEVINWLKKKAEPMGIVKPFKIVGQAHTHHAGKTWGDFGVVGIEMGCMAKVPDYDGDPKVRGGGPTVLGYTVFYQENGITDINASNFVQLA